MKAHLGGCARACSCVVIGLAVVAIVLPDSDETGSTAPSPIPIRVNHPSITDPVACARHRSVVPENLGSRLRCVR